jgi:energy-coupling factor transporter ATP-binding protein EcfA2
VRLLELTLESAPGLSGGFTLGPFGPGINVVHGPNGAGKSSAGRALLGLLWPDGETRQVRASARFAWQGQGLSAELSGGQVRWSGGPSDGPPRPDKLYRRRYLLGVRELLDLGQDGERDFARSLRASLSGGLDLEALLSGPFALRPREGRHLADELAKQRQERRLAEQRLAVLAADEQRLATLELELEQAALADARRRWCRLALERETRRAEQAGWRAAWAQLPPGLSLLSPRDGQELEHLEGDRQRAEQRLLTARRALKGATPSALARTGQGGAPGTSSAPVAHGASGALRPLGAKGEPDERSSRAPAAALLALPAALDSWAEAERQAGAAESALRAEAARLAALGSTLERSAAELLPEPHHDPDWGRAELAELERWLDRHGDLLARRAERQAALELLPAAPSGAPRKAIERSLADLRRYLASPSAERLGTWAVWAWLALGLALAALLIAVLRTGELWLGLCAGGSLVAAGAALRAREQMQALSRERRAILERVTARGLGLPSRWDDAGVSQRLESLEDELEAGKQAQARELQRLRLAADLANLEAELGELEARCEPYFAELGLRAEAGALEKVEIARRLEQQRQARLAAARAQAAADEAQRRLVQAQSRASALLSCAGLALQVGPGALERARAAVAERQQSLAQERAEAEHQRSLVQALEQAQEEHGRLEQRWRGFFEQRQLAAGQRGELERRLAARADFQRLQQQAVALEADLARLERELAEAPAELLALDQSALLDAVERAEKQAERAGPLRAEIARIQAALAAARERDGLADLEAAERALQLRLHDTAREVYERATAAELLRAAFAAHQHSLRPAQQRRAAELLRAFTAGRYDLELVRGSEAKDPLLLLDLTRGERLSPAALSDGTRLQLRIALAIAAIEQQERGTPLPLILDEALRLSDPTRLRALFACLVGLAAAGRQILYLSADPGDGALLTELAAEMGAAPPVVLDLGAARRLSPSLELPRAPLPRTLAPRYQGQSSADYARALGVRSPRPFEPPESLHLFFLLEERPTELEVLLDSGLQTLGQLERAPIGALAALLTAPGAGEQLLCLGRLARAALTAWHIGRGQRVDREALERAGVTDKFLAPLETLAESVGGRSAELLELLSQKSLAGFGPNRQAQLREALTLSGHFDGRPPLERSALVLGLLAEFEPSIRALGVNATALRARVERWLDLLDAGWPTAPSQPVSPRGDTAARAP